jgi:hypothetical protein
MAASSNECVAGVVTASFPARLYLKIIGFFRPGKKQRKKQFPSIHTLSAINGNQK